MTIPRVLFTVLAAGLVSYLGFALLNGTWAGHPHSALVWAIYLAGFLVIGLLASWGVRWEKRRRTGS